MTAEIYHLALPGDWAASTDEYRTSSLDEEGFIHCSTADQVAEVARRLYHDHNDLILLTIDPSSLGDTLTYEDLYDLGEEFPHIYGPLPTSAVVSTAPYLEHLEEGLWRDGTRFDQEWMDRMLHPEFSEVGRSGRTYTRAQAIAASSRSIESEIPLAEYRIQLIDEDVALVRYISRQTLDGAPRPAERTSVWVNTNDGWRLRFHQGTPFPEG
ncbi:MAG TPA: DUF952 domain-containing protein [Acidimicrobiia bacterium]|nr:DUF952 domain-containing protein [Acidimicrobiia bacterium]